jgi:hypothetical protein
MKRLSIVGASTLLVLGCATSSVDRKVPTEFVRSAKCGVVAFVNDPIKFEYVGLTIFTNETKTVSVRQVDMPARIERAVVEELKATLPNRVEIVKLDNRAALDAMLFTPADGSNPSNARSGALRQIREVATAQGFNCLIAIIPVAYSWEIHPRQTDGLGFIGRLTWSYAYFSGTYQIVSLPDGKAVAWGLLKSDPNSNIFTQQGPSVLSVRVDPKSYLEDARADSVALNDKTVSSLVATLPEIARLIAANVADALSSPAR